MPRSPTHAHDSRARETVQPCPRAARVADSAGLAVSDDDALQVCQHLATNPHGPLLAVLSLNDGQLRCVQCAGRIEATFCAWCGTPDPTRLLAFAVELECDHTDGPYEHRFLVSGWLCAECDGRGRPPGRWRAADLRESLESAGHSGICDQLGCAAAAEYAIAEDCEGGCDHADTPAVTAYCAEHIAGPPVARREAIEGQLWRDAETGTSTWHLLLAAYPHPLSLARGDRGRRP